MKLKIYSNLLWATFFIFAHTEWWKVYFLPAWTPTLTASFSVSRNRFVTSILQIRYIDLNILPTTSSLPMSQNVVIPFLSWNVIFFYRILFRSSDTKKKNITQEAEENCNWIYETRLSYIFTNVIVRKRLEPLQKILSKLLWRKNFMSLLTSLY